MVNLSIAVFADTTAGVLRTNDTFKMTGTSTWASRAAVALLIIGQIASSESWREERRSRQDAAIPRGRMGFSASLQRYPQPDIVEQRLGSILHQQNIELQQRFLRPSLVEEPSVVDTQQDPTTNTNNATTATSASSTSTPNHRFMAMVHTQDPCPTRQQWSHYTDILLSYTTTLEDDGTCSETCEMDLTLKVCDNQPNPDLLQEWHTAGKRVWLVVGGPSMGKNYDLVSPACWEFCFGRHEQMVENIVTMVNATTSSLHGVVISYQYLYENNEGNSGFLRGDEAQTFVRGLTMGLRETLDSNMQLAHMPVDSSIVIGTESFSLLSEMAQSKHFDLLMPQYYNGVVRPASNPQGALQHFDILVTFMFLGDASRIVFGMCNNDADTFYCGGSDYTVDSVEGASIMKSLSNVYPCHGGAFFWSAASDPSGFWSIPLLAEYSPTLIVEECKIEVEEEIHDDKNDKEDEGCVNPLAALTCAECVETGCSWCTVDGKPTCQTKQNNGTECLEVCLPEEPREEEILTPNSLVQHHIKMEGLSQEIFGITGLPVESAQSLQEMHANYVKSFFASQIDENLLLDSNITIVEVILPSMFSRSLRRASTGRNLQHDGSSVVVIFDQEVSYWYPVIQQMLSPETLSIVPFATESARDELTSMLQTSTDSVLTQVLGVSEITVAPQAPTESPVMPPITTLSPTTMTPTVRSTPLPTPLQQITPTANPASPPSGGITPGGPASPTNNPPVIASPSSPPLAAPTPANQPVIVTNPTPSITTTPNQPSLVPVPAFNTDPPNPVTTFPPVPLTTAAPTPNPTMPPPTSPLATPKPTNRPTPSPTNTPPPPSGGSSSNDNNKNDGENGDYPIFGKYTGFIVIAIVFGGLLLIFAFYMKYCMGEYVDA